MNTRPHSHPIGRRGLYTAVSINSLLKFGFVSALFLIGVGFFSCKSSSNPLGPNDLDGATDIPLTKVGNQYSTSLVVGSTYVSMTDSVTITKNDNGLVTVHAWADLSTLPPAYAAVKAVIPPQFLDSKGNFNTDLKFKVTEHGIQEYFYSNGDMSKPFTIAKYDDGVGTSYSFTTSDGKTVTRTITEKSGLDEWPMGFLLIKTSAIEETPAITGIQKIVFRVNHRFGLVWIQWTLSDGTTKVGLSLMPLANL